MKISVESQNELRRVSDEILDMGFVLTNWTFHVSDGTFTAWVLDENGYDIEF